MISFTSRGCLWRPRPPPPAAWDWVLSPALWILAVPREAARLGSWPHFLQLGPCPAPWPRPLGTGRERPLGPDPLTQGPPGSSSAKAKRALSSCRVSGPLPPPWGRPPGAHQPFGSCSSSRPPLRPGHLLREASTVPSKAAPTSSPSNTAFLSFFIACVTVWRCFGPQRGACGESEFPDQGSNPRPLQWTCRTSATGPPGKSLQFSGSFFSPVGLLPSPSRQGPHRSHPLRVPSMALAHSRCPGMFSSGKE